VTISDETACGFCHARSRRAAIQITTTKGADQSGRCANIDTTEQNDERTGDGDLSDLLSELRILLPGAQMLTAFLVILPFNGGFDQIRQEERYVYLATFLCALVSLVSSPPPPPSTAFSAR